MKQVRINDSRAKRVVDDENREIFDDINGCNECNDNNDYSDFND